MGSSKVIPHETITGPLLFIINSRVSNSRRLLLRSYYNSKNLNCIGALSFFKICSHIFMIFEVKLE